MAIRWFKFNDELGSLVNLEDVECVQPYEFQLSFEIRLRMKNGNKYVVCYKAEEKDNFEEDVARLNNLLL